MNFVNEFNQFFKESCLPAQVYFVAVIINALVTAFGMKMNAVIVLVTFIVQILIIFIITYFTNMLCKNHLTFISWLIALLPVIYLLSNVAKFLKIKA